MIDRLKTLGLVIGASALICVASTAGSLPHQAAVQNAIFSGGGGLTMPPGSLGIWYADQYSATPRPYVPNALSPGYAPVGIMTANRGLFNDASNYWPSRQAITIVDRAGTSPDGTSNAASIVGTGASTWLVQRSITLSAGTYTVAVAMKRNTGSDQLFRINFSGFSADLTATSAWQRFTKTATFGAGATNVGIWVSSTAADASLLVDEIQVYSGSSDLGSESLVGHMYLGTHAGDATSTAAVYSSGAIDLSAGGLGRIQFGVPTTYTTISAVALMSQLSTKASYSALAQSFDDWTGFGLYTSYSTTQGLTLGFGGQVYPANTQNGQLLSGKGFHGVGWRFDGTKFNTFLDDLSWGQTTSSASTHAMQSIKLGQTVGTGPPYPYKIHALAIANRAWTDAEMLQAYNYLYAHAAATGITPTVASRVVCAEGDSITAPYIPDGAQSYASLYPTNASPYAYVQIRAISGNKVSDLSARATAVDALIRAVTARGGKCILSVLVGPNDYDAGGTDKSNFLTNLAAYLDARRSAGAVVALGTMLPRTASGFNTWRNTQNATLSTWVGVHCDAIFDFAAEATMGPDAAASNTTYYNVDGTHPKAAGQTLLEAVYRPVINGL